MKIMKSGITCLLYIVLLSGCSMETIQSKPIYQKSGDTKTLVNQEKWEQAKQQADVIDTLFKENKWKYQLLGNETEYSSLDAEIKKLQMSLEEKDKKEAKRNIAVMEHYIESLYFR